MLPKQKGIFNLTLTRETVPGSDNIDEHLELLERKDAFEQFDIYPRDGLYSLGDAEAKAATLIGAKPEEVLVFNSGMAAIDTSLETALCTSDKEELKIARSGILYSQSAGRISNTLAKLRIKNQVFDSGDQDSLTRLVDNDKLSVIFAETVGNGPGTPVLDYRILLNGLRNQKNPPTLILDNTLPLSTGLKLIDEINEEDRVIVLESGTKSYTQNGELSGIVYTKNPDLLNELKIKRREKGNNPGVGSSDRISYGFPEAKRPFDERNLRLFRNSAILAKILDDIAQERDDFIVSNPALFSHDNFALGKELGLPNGGSPVSFIQPLSLEPGSHIKIASEIWSKECVKDNACLGQSFGFDQTRLLIERRSNTIRVAAGAETDVEELGEGFRKALLA